MLNRANGGNLTLGTTATSAFSPWAVVVDSTGAGFGSINASHQLVRDTVTTVLTATNSTNQNQDRNFTTTPTDNQGSAGVGYLGGTGTGGASTGYNLSLTNSPAHQTNSLFITTLNFGTSNTLDLGGNELVLNSGTLGMSGAGNFTIQNGQILGEVYLGVVQAGSGTLTLKSTISSSGADGGDLYKGGSGLLVLASANAYLGPTSVNAGTLQLATGGSINTSTVNSAGSGNTLITSGTGSFDLNGISQAFGLVANNSASVNAITNSNATAATVTIGNGSNGIGAFSGNLNVVWNQGASSSTITGNFNNAGTITNSGTGIGTATIGGIIGSNVTGVIENSSTSTLSLYGVNTFTSGLTIKNGTVIGSDYATAFGTGTITLGDSAGSANATLNGGTNNTFDNPIVVASGSTGIATITNSALAGATFSGPITLNNNLTVVPSSSSSSSLTLNGGITGTGNLTLSIPGTGGLTIAGGIVNNAGSITVSGTGTGGDGGPGPIISSDIGSNVTSLTMNDANSVLTLSGTNSYSGPTTINGGTLTVGAGGTLGATTAALAVNNTNAGPGTAVVLNLLVGANTTSGPLSGTIATPSSGTNTVTINNGGASHIFTVNQTAPGTFAGVIAGQGGFSLGSLSSAALTLSGANTYSGGTAINAGTLLTTNTIGSATGTNSVTVSSGAVLGGGGGGTTGFIGGLVTISGGGNLAPNGFAGTASTGTVTKLTLSGGLTLSSGAVLDYILGTSSDMVTLGAGKTLTLNPGVTLNVTQGSGFSAGTTYVLVHYSGLTDNSGSFSGWTANGVPSGSTATFGLDAVGDNLDVKFSPQSNNLASYSGGAGGPFGTAATTSVSISGSGSSYVGITSSVASETNSTPAANGFGPLLTDDGTPQHIVLYGETLAGSNSGNFTGNGAATVSMAWRNRTLQETTLQEGGAPSSPPLPAANAALISNVLNLSGMSTSGGEPVQTDPFMLQMNYDTALLGNEAAEAASGAIYLAWLNPNGGGSGVPLWQNAITGDTGGLTAPGAPIYLGSFLNYVNSLDGNASFPLFTTPYTTTTLGNLTNAQLEEILGDWGVDTANHDAWAVIDHNSEFAVVPEPATLTLAGLGFFGWVGYCLRRRRQEKSCPAPVREVT